MTIAVPVAVFCELTKFCPSRLLAIYCAGILQHRCLSQKFALCLRCHTVQNVTAVTFCSFCTGSRQKQQQKCSALNTHRKPRSPSTSKVHAARCEIQKFLQVQRAEKAFETNNSESHQIIVSSSHMHQHCTNDACKCQQSSISNSESF